MSVNIGSTFAGDVDVKTMSSVGFDGNTLYVDDASNKNQVDMHSFNGLATLRNGNTRSYYYMDGSDHQKEREDEDVISRGHQFYGQSNA